MNYLKTFAAFLVVTAIPHFVILQIRLHCDHCFQQPDQVGLTLAFGIFTVMGLIFAYFMFEELTKNKNKNKK